MRRGEDKLHPVVCKSLAPSGRGGILPGQTHLVFSVGIYSKTFWDGGSTLLEVLQKVIGENHSRFFFSMR
jgi:hypothetical protein